MFSSQTTEGFHETALLIFLTIKIPNISHLIWQVSQVPSALKEEHFPPERTSLELGNGVTSDRWQQILPIPILSKKPRKLLCFSLEKSGICRTTSALSPPPCNLINIKLACGSSLENLLEPPLWQSMASSVTTAQRNLLSLSGIKWRSG